MKYQAISHRAFGRPAGLGTFVLDGDGLDAIEPPQELPQTHFLEPGRRASHFVALFLVAFLVSG